MSNSKTYAVGSNGTVKRSINNGTWTDASITNSFPVTSQFSLNDVKTDPNNIDKVFVVGEGRLGTGAFGVYVSTNGGYSWYIPGGDYQTNTFGLLTSLRWYEISIIDSNTIVICGDYGRNAISLDGGLTFNLVNKVNIVIESPGGDPVTPTCYSLYWLNNLVGITASKSHVFKTLDGGNSWTTLNSGNWIGTTQAMGIYGVYLSADENTIVALASNYIYRSVDGGITWTDVYALPIITGQYGAGLHLTWDNNQLWVVGKGGLKLYSPDEGINWIVKSLYAPISADHFAAHIYQEPNGFYSSGDLILRTYNGLTTGTIETAFPSERQVNAIWSAQQEPTCWVLTSCDNSIAPIVVSNDLSSALNKVVMLCPGDMNFRMTAPAAVQDVGIAIGQDAYAVSPSFYYLSSCCGTVPPIKVMNDLGAYLGLTVTIPAIDPTVCWFVQNSGPVSLTPFMADMTNSLYYPDCDTCVAKFPCSNIVPTLTECTCFTVTGPILNCSGSITLNVTPQIYNDCTECNSEQCYYLVDCSNPENYIITDTDLSLEVNNVIKIKYSSVCWYVSEAVSCTGKIAVEVTDSYSTCSECNPSEEQTIPDLKPRSIKPGLGTTNCPPDYVIKTNCSFADQTYQKMVALRYGIKFCCKEDLQKWTIKKSLLDLNSLYDPSLCVNQFQECCPPECVTASLTQFIPYGCPVPELIEAILEYPTNCLEPDSIRASLELLDNETCNCFEMVLSIGAEFSALMEYRPCQAALPVQVTLTPGSTRRVCSVDAPILISGSLPIITQFPGSDCCRGV